MIKILLCASAILACIIIPSTVLALCPDVAVVTIDILPTPTPTPAVPAPSPTVLPELPDYNYDAADARCLSRAIWSITPAHPTYNTKLALCEVVQNRVDDENGVYKDSIRSVLLQPGEFLDYDPNAYRSETNNDIADYAMRSWVAAHIGDRAYRLTPANGTVCNFYRLDGWDFIQVFDRNGNLVYDSGE